MAKRDALSCLVKKRLSEWSTERLICTPCVRRLRQVAVIMMELWERPANSAGTAPTIPRIGPPTDSSWA